MIQTSLKVTGIDHVVLWVSDLQRSKEFYIGLLGMRVDHEREGTSFLWCGEHQMVALFQQRAGEDVSGGREVNHMALRLEAGEYEDVKATLEAAGCVVDGRQGDPHCLYFSDPDGHRLQVLTPSERG
ncbi:MAG TPA: VOC family protein [Bryobacteraceae bacterium]|nr:VOC family protein [Bryobacteraceae bacterium]